MRSIKERPGKCFINYSPDESRITGLMTGRSGLIENLDEKELKKIVLSEKYDLIRIKVCADDIFLFDKLKRMNFQYHIYNVQLRNMKEINSEDGKYIVPSGLHCEIMNDGHKKFIKNLVKETIENDSGVNFHSALFSEIVSRKMLLESALEYACSFMHPNKEGKTGWVLKVNGEVGGFCICRQEGGHMEGLLYGIKKRFRGKNYSGVLINTVKKYCYQNQIKTLCNNVVMQNQKSLKSMINEGVMPQKLYFNIFLFPLLGRGKGSGVRI